ncbi:MAG TPA: DNA-3-methyladenine glycosylase [Candidatus Dormibacteraeota bacterium]|nr:DNA-3-methyladenine glycosylase [Candidatus Dormibacteraeota bacterium]
MRAQRIQSGSFARQHRAERSGSTRPCRGLDADRRVERRTLPYTPIAPNDLPVETTALARALIGYVLAHDTPQGLVAGRIVETEAYPPGDLAAHHYGGRTQRNASLFLPAHHAYVYYIYGSSFCFNLSSEDGGVGGGVLVRALEPLLGAELMCARRGSVAARDLCRGPGRLCRALGIDRRFDGIALFGEAPLWLASPDRARRSVGTSRRIGVSRASTRLLRFYERGNRFVSGPRSLSPA